MKKSIAWATVSALAMTSPQPARPQGVELALAGASLTSTIIGLGGSGSNPQLTATLAQMRMLEAIGHRLTAVENALLLILDKLDAFPDQIRDALREDGDRRRIEEMISAIDTLKSDIDELPGAERKGKKAGSEKRWVINKEISEFRDKRGILFQRSDLVVPEIVSALVAEVTAKTTVQLGYDLEEHVFKEYYARLLDVDSPDKPKSLFNLRKDLESNLEEQERKIAFALTRKQGAVLDEAIYPWYSHTRTHPERRIRSELTGSSGYDPISGTTGKDVSSVPYTENVADHTRTLGWVIDRIPLDDENAAGLYYLHMSISVTETKGGKAGSTAHQSPDIEYEKSVLREDTPEKKQKQQLERLLDGHKKTVDAIKSIRQLQAIASAGRSLIVNWDLAQAQKLASRIQGNSFDTQEQLNRVKQNEREAASQKSAEEIAEAQKNFDTVTAESRRQVEHAMELSRKDKWRSDFANYVTLASQSYNFYHVAASYVQSTAPTQPLDVKGKPRAAVAGQRAAPQAAAPPDNGGRKGKGMASAIMQPEAPSNRTPKFNVTIATQRQIYEHMQNLIRDVEQHPAKNWTNLSDRPLVHQEIELMELQQTRPLLRETEADKLATSSSQQAMDAGTSVAIGLGGGGPAGALKAAAKEALKPVYLADGTLLGAASIRALDERIEAQTREYFKARFGDVMKVPLVDECSLARACLKTYNKPFP